MTEPTPERVDAIGPDEPLYVCPGCLAIGNEECSAGCPDRAFSDERRQAQCEDETDPFDLNESFDWGTEP